MKMNKYHKLSLRTAPDNLKFEEILLNSALGLCGESGEFAERVKKYIYHKDYFDRVEMVKELGDILWYIAYAANSLGVSLQDVAECNLIKLSTRYPTGFSEQASKDRVDTK